MDLEISKGERVLGVKVVNDLAFNVYIRAATAKANSVIGMLKNDFVSRDVNIWLKLYVKLGVCNFGNHPSDVLISCRGGRACVLR